MFSNPETQQVEEARLAGIKSDRADTGGSVQAQERQLCAVVVLAGVQLPRVRTACL